MPRPRIQRVPNGPIGTAMRGYETKDREALETFGLVPDPQPPRPSAKQDTGFGMSVAQTQRREEMKKAMSKRYGGNYQ